MPLPSSGPITLNQIHTEVGGSSNSTASLSDPDIRQLIGAQQGDTISMGEFLGQAAPISVSIANDISNSVNKMNVASYLSSQGWNGVGAATLTIPSNVWVWSDSTGTAGMTISGSFPNGLTINNNGKIIGKGGDAGDNSNTTGGSANGSNGGNAINITSSSNITINNNSGAFIAGGGGGGAAADQLKNTSGQNLSGGAGSNVSGGGGGAGGGSGGAGTTFAAEPGGAINQTGDPVQLSGTTYTTAAGAGGLVVAQAVVVSCMALVVFLLRLLIILVHQALVVAVPTILQVVLEGLLLTQVIPVVLSQVAVAGAGVLLGAV